MAVPESDTGDSADGEDIASTDMSSEPSSRTDETQPQFLGGQDTRLVDDLDRLVASDPSTPLTSLREGLSAVDRKLWKELQDAGVERIDPVGTAFDPALHEAVSTTPAPERSKEHVVSATFQPGYLFKGTMVRPARVQVYSEQAQR